MSAFGSSSSKSTLPTRALRRVQKVIYVDIFDIKMRGLQSPNHDRLRTLKLLLQELQRFQEDSINDATFRCLK